MRLDTKIAIVVRADLAVWQKLNVTAFLASAVAAGGAGTSETASGAGRVALQRRHHDRPGHVWQQHDPEAINNHFVVYATIGGRRHRLV